MRRQRGQRRSTFVSSGSSSRIDINIKVFKYKYMKKNIKLILSLSLIVLLGAVYGGYRYYEANKFYYAPRNESNLFALGQIEASKGRHAEAVKIFQEMLSKDPKHTVAIKFMIDSMLKLDDRTNIFPSLDKLVQLEPSKENFEFAASVSLQLQDKLRSEAYLKQAKDLK